jgi:hypothetical protein
MEPHHRHDCTSALSTIARPALTAVVSDRANHYRLPFLACNNLRRRSPCSLLDMTRAISTFAAVGFVWFELDFEAETPEGYPDSGMRFIVECKCHDPTRFRVVSEMCVERIRYHFGAASF